MNIFTAHQRSGVGNVFSRVCLSTGGKGFPPYRSPTLVQVGPHCTVLPRTGPCTPPPMYRVPTQTCSYFFNLDLTVIVAPPPPYSNLLHYEACTVGKQAVGIVLECFLVLFFAEDPGLKTPFETSSNIPHLTCNASTITSIQILSFSKLLSLH